MKLRKMVAMLLVGTMAVSGSAMTAMAEEKEVGEVTVADGLACDMSDMTIAFIYQDL